MLQRILLGQARRMARAASPLPRIGCAGWSVVAAHRPLLGAGDSMLARYATRFDCVEINSSFYRSHQRDTYARWAASVPAAFRFTVKLPQAITHELALRRARIPLQRFLEEVAGLRSKLGGLLVQLPPSLPFDPRSANAFFKLLREQFDGPVACEPRHASWFTPARDEFCHRHRIARVAADPPRQPGGDLPAGDASQWRYWRLHGSPVMYRSRYEDDVLQRLAAATRTAARRHWIVFDNTASGHAANDAARLQEFCAALRRKH
jgi:uncharacterized protein YecE (DUF72 family)